mmetsp:Transcript_1162/g.1898  ORF Transcript_1162/g.1898 Transcript_1162/m.1898 type:complete len:421 (-) Transcript_1162:250-1512(-)
MEKKKRRTRRVNEPLLLPLHLLILLSVSEMVLLTHSSPSLSMGWRHHHHHHLRQFQRQAAFQNAFVSHSFLRRSEAKQQQQRHNCLPRLFKITTTKTSPSFKSTTCRNMMSSSLQQPQNKTHTSNAEVKRTRYTIDETVFPPTNTTTLQTILTKHAQSLPLYLSSKPIPKHTAVAFQEVKECISLWQSQQEEKDDKGGIILDSGCGTGKSTLLLSQQYPNDLVIGIDRSVTRLTKNKYYNKKQQQEEVMMEEQNDNEMNNMNFTQFIPPNILLVRAELASFWQCVYNDNLQPEQPPNDDDHHHHSWPKIKRHYLLYPNPYPKPKRVQSRWYGHPSFPLLMNPIISGECVIVRSNWKGYLEEFALSANFVEQLQEQVSEWNMEGPTRLFFNNGDEANVPLTNFETKYVDCGEPVYELVLHR